MDNQLVLKIEAKSGVLSFNKDEIMKTVKDITQRYKDIVIEEKDIKDAKELRAKLNKINKGIDEKRKEIKKEYSKPLDIFESDIKKICAEVTKVTDLIDSQLEVYANKAKEKKKEEIVKYYNELPISELVALDRIFDNRWLNVTCKDWDKQILAIVENFKQSLELIEQFNLSEEEKSELKSIYLEYLDLQRARKEFESRKIQSEKIAKMQEAKEAKPLGSVTAPKVQVEAIQTLKETAEAVEPAKEKVQKIVAEFIAARSFYDEMNELIKKHDVRLRIISREDVK